MNYAQVAGGRVRYSIHFRLLVSCTCFRCEFLPRSELIKRSQLIDISCVQNETFTPIYNKINGITRLVGKNSRCPWL